MKTLIDYYDDFAEMWADRWYPNDELLPYLKHFINLLPNNPRVLDLCCGAGYESMRLNSLGAKVVGTDLSEKSIEIAKLRNPEIEFYVKDMLKSYADLGSFDGIACIAGLVHIPENKIELAFKNMYEVLKDNSYLFIVVRDGDKITKSIEVEGVEYAREFYCYTVDKIKQHSKKYFQFVEELEENGDWRYYILKKMKDDFV